MLEITECIGADIFSEQFADSPQLVAFLEAHFAGIENTSARRQLLEAADVSEFSLHQWVESLSICLLYTSPSPRDLSTSRMPSSA